MMNLDLAGWTVGKWRKVVGSNPGCTNTQGLKITEEKVLPLQ